MTDQPPIQEELGRLFRQLRGDFPLIDTARRIPAGEPQRSIDCTCGHFRQKHLPGDGTKSAPTGRCTMPDCSCQGYVRTDKLRPVGEHAAPQIVLHLEEGANTTLARLARLEEPYGVQFRVVAVDPATGEPVKGESPLFQRLRSEWQEAG